METTRGIFRRILNWIGRLALVLVLALASLWVAILVPRAYYIRQAARPSSAFIVEDAPVIALIHARVIDGTGSPAMDDQTIVISRGKSWRSVPPLRICPVFGCTTVTSAITCWQGWWRVIR